MAVQECSVIKKLRKSRSLTQREMAEMLEIKQGSLSDIERGRIGISSKIKEKVSELFSLPHDWHKQSEFEQISTINKSIANKHWLYCPHCGKTLK